MIHQRVFDDEVIHRIQDQRRIHVVVETGIGILVVSLTKRVPEADGFVKVMRLRHEKSESSSQNPRRLKSDILPCRKTGMISGKWRSLFVILCQDMRRIRNSRRQLEPLRSQLLDHLADLLDIVPQCVGNTEFSQRVLGQAPSQPEKQYGCVTKNERSFHDSTSASTRETASAIRDCSGNETENASEPINGMTPEGLGSGGSNEL